MLVLEYLRVLLSAQMVWGIVCIAFLLLFKSEFASLLSRIASIRFGSAELSAPQLPNDPTASNRKTETTNFPATSPPELPQGITVSEADAKRLEQALHAERARAHLWEYRYLNYFFVLNTQRVLNWLANLPSPVTFTMYDAWWQPVIPTAEQRRTIINVLESHNLVVLNGELIEVTPKGKEYIQWRGPQQLPAIPSTGESPRV